MDDKELVERAEWFTRDPVTGNFVRATPPAQFSTGELQAMLEEKVRLASRITVLREALVLIAGAPESGTAKWLRATARKALSGEESE